VFIGFGDRDELVLNGLARLLHRERRRLSRVQLATLALLREGHSQAEIAKQLRLTRQAVSSRARSAGWEAFAEGERAWRTVLTPFDLSNEWQASR
jgi:transcriptional regulator